MEIILTLRGKGRRFKHNIKIKEKEIKIMINDTLDLDIILLIHQNDEKYVDFHLGARGSV
jgi:hypothetical protein